MDAVRCRADFAPLLKSWAGRRERSQGAAGFAGNRSESMLALPGALLARILLSRLRETFHWRPLP